MNTTVIKKRNLDCTLHLNTKLITSLKSALSMSNSKLMKAASISCTTWYKILKRPDDITVQQLLAIANGLRIPVHCFFYTGNNNTIGQCGDYIIANYRPCDYDADALQNVVNTRPDATWLKAAKATGMSYARLKESVLGKRRTPVTRFLTVCYAYDIDPFSILFDPNQVQKQKANKRKTSNMPVDATNSTPSNSEIAKLRAEVATLRKQVENLILKAALEAKKD